MLVRFNQYLLDKKIYQSSHKLVCAVSGGMDSMAMLHAFAMEGYDVVVGHINHSSRPGENEAEEDLVKRFCNKYHLKYYIKKLDPEIAKQSNFQEVARNIRYEYLESIRKEEGAHYIATAHHADDNVETFFINLLRSSGLNGLSAIPDIAHDVIRLLIGVDRESIRTYVKDNSVPFLEDSSNSSDKYLRNNIRHHLIPALIQIDTRYPQAIINAINHIISAKLVLGHLVNEQVLFEGQLKRIKKNILPPALMPEFLYQAVHELGFNKSQVNDMMQSDRVGATAITHTHRLINEREEYVIAPLSTVPLDPLQIDGFGTYHLADGRTVIVSSSQDLKGDLWFERAPWPLIIRSKKNGDKFQPKGLKGRSKSVKKTTIDKKLSTIEKEAVLIVEQNGSIVSLLNVHDAEGYQYSDKNTYGVSMKLINSIKSNLE